VIDDHIGDERASKTPSLECRILREERVGRPAPSWGRRAGSWSSRGHGRRRGGLGRGRRCGGC
jgi:hypothetical protein